MKRTCEKCGGAQYMGAVNWLPCEGCEKVNSPTGRLFTSRKPNARNPGRPEDLTVSVGGQECVPYQDPGVVSWDPESTARHVHNALLWVLGKAQCAHTPKGAGLDYCVGSDGAYLHVDCGACGYVEDLDPSDWLKTVSGEPTPDWALAAIRALVPGQEGLGLPPMGSLSMDVRVMRDACGHTRRGIVAGVDVCPDCWKHFP